MENIPLPIPADNRILFFDRDSDLFGFMSNFYEAAITVDGEIWRSSEFYYQSQKSHHPEYREAIRHAKNSDHAKGIGSDPTRSRKSRKRSWFTGQVDLMRADWHEAKLEVMLKAVRAKFDQNPELRTKLLATGEAEIVEDSPHDPFWGIGRNGDGLNQMGKVLMQVREELREGLI